MNTDILLEALLKFFIAVLIIPFTVNFTVVFTYHFLSFLLPNAISGFLARFIIWRHKSNDIQKLLIFVWLSAIIIGTIWLHLFIYELIIAFAITTAAMLLRK